MSPRRYAGVVAAPLSLLLVLLLAPSAHAHTVNGQPIPDARHYLTQVTGMTPKVRGITVQADPRGEWLSVTNTTSQTLTVLGYFHEPYIEVRADGVWENELSSTRVLNQSLFATLNGTEPSNLPPLWDRTSSGNTARWHDHRIHWMSSARPPHVQAHPSTRQLIGRWQVSMQLGKTPITVSGTLTWLPIKTSGLTPVTILLIAVDAVFVALGVVCGFFLFARRRRGASAAPGPALATGPTELIDAPDPEVHAREP